MRIRVAIWIFAQIVFVATTTAQAAGKLRFIVDPGSGYSFVLDHQYRMQQREVDLIAGPHHFTFWAPERRMIDTTINVVEGRTREITILLPYSDEYRKYERDLRDLKKQTWLNVALPSVLTIGAGVLMGSGYRKYKNAHEQLEADEQAYRSGSDPLRIAQLKDVLIPSHKSELADKRGVFYLTTGVFAAVAAGSAYMIIRHAKRPAPSFRDAEKVRFDGLVWVPSSGGGYFMTGLHIDLR